MAIADAPSFRQELARRGRLGPCCSRSRLRDEKIRNLMADYLIKLPMAEENVQEAECDHSHPK